MNIKIFVFNTFQVNTYLLYDETKECVIIDPGCNDAEEEEELLNFLRQEQLTLVACLITHAHIDHVLGNNFIFNKFGLKPILHRSGIPFLQNLPYYGRTFGFKVDETVMPVDFLKEGMEIRFGNSVLQVLETPGHADGSVCFVAKEDRFVISGDVLFFESIGRTDLPTGDYELLAESISKKIFSLPEDFIVYPGHGHETTIEHEMRFNPFLEKN